LHEFLPPRTAASAEKKAPVSGAAGERAFATRVFSVGRAANEDFALSDLSLGVAQPARRLMVAGAAADTFAPALPPDRRISSLPAVFGFLYFSFFCFPSVFGVPLRSSEELLQIVEHLRGSQLFAGNVEMVQSGASSSCWG
jgi:hypothetical protein